MGAGPSRICTICGELIAKEAIKLEDKDKPNIHCENCAERIRQEKKRALERLREQHLQCGNCGTDVVTDVKFAEKQSFFLCKNCSETVNKLLVDCNFQSLQLVVNSIIAHGQLVPPHYTEALNRVHVREITAGGATFTEETAEVSYRKRCSVM